jgi:hypothetical protein
MEGFIVGIIVGAVLVYFYHKSRQPKSNYNDATGIPDRSLPEERDRSDKKM